MAKEGGDRQDRRAGRGTILRPTGPLRRWLAPAATLAAFAAVNAFWAYTATGQWTDFKRVAYARDLGTPLQEAFLAPLSVLTHPRMILIQGLLLSAAIFVPIIVTAMHRAPVAGLFVIVVAAIGHAPVLALMLAIGCVLVVQTPLRRTVPFLAAMVGMIPVVIYLYLSVLIGPGVQAVLPMQKWAPLAPFVLAAVAAVIAVAVVLAVADWTGRRPLAVWATVAALPMIAPAIFYARIGPAELDYQLIAQQIGLDNELFPSVSRADWAARPDAAGLGEPELRNSAKDDLDYRRGKLVEQCEGYLARYPRGRRAAEVAWLAAQCLSLRLNEPAYDAGVVRYDASHPPPGSRAKWRQLIQQYPDAPNAALATWRVGQLALRAGQCEQADELLLAAAEQLREIRQAHRADANSPTRAVFSKPRTVPSPQYYARALFRAERALWLMGQNRVLEDANAAKALAEYLDANPIAMTADRHLARLSILAGKYENTRLGENLKLAVAKAMPDLKRRIEQLVLLAEQSDDLDAAVEANYELAQLTLRGRDLQKQKGIKSPREYLEIVKAAPPSPWTTKAARCLRMLAPTTRPKEPAE